MICSPKLTASANNDDHSSSSSSSGAGDIENSDSSTGSADGELLVLFSDEDDEHSFFEIAIHRHRHKQNTEIASDSGSSSSVEDSSESDDEIELRISFSSSSLLPSSPFFLPLMPKNRVQRETLLDGVASRNTAPPSPTSPEFCPSGDYIDKTATVEGVVMEQKMRGQVCRNAVLSKEDKAIQLNSNWELIPGYCSRKPSKTPAPAMNGSGILKFLLKFPATVKIQKLLSSLAKVTTIKAPSPHDQGNINVNNRAGSSQVSKRLQYCHKFIKKSLNKWLLPITKDMKNYCHFHETDLIVISSTERKRNKNLMIKTKTKGSNPSSIKSSPIHDQNSTSGYHDHHQSSIQSAIAHCRRSSTRQQTSEFCFPTSSSSVLS